MSVLYQLPDLALDPTAACVHQAAFWWLEAHIIISFNGIYILSLSHWPAIQYMACLVSHSMDEAGV